MGGNEMIANERIARAIEAAADAHEGGRVDSGDQWDDGLRAGITEGMCRAAGIARAATLPTGSCAMTCAQCGAPIPDRPAAPGGLPRTITHSGRGEWSIPNLWPEDEIRGMLP